MHFWTKQEQKVEMENPTNDCWYRTRRAKNSSSRNRTFKKSSLNNQQAISHAKGVKISLYEWCFERFENDSSSSNGGLTGIENLWAAKKRAHIHTMADYEQKSPENGATIAYKDASIPTKYKSTINMWKKAMD